MALSLFRNFFGRRQRDTAASVAMNAGAPQLERDDAMLEIAKGAAADAARILSDANLLVKAYAASHPTTGREERREPGLAIHNLDLGTDGQRPLYYSRPVGLGFDQLRQMVSKTAPVKAVITTRVRQVQRFLRPSKDEWRPGFRLRYSDDQRKLTDADNAKFQFLEKYLLNCGATFDSRERRRLRRDNLTTFAAKHIADSLTADHAPVELIPTAAGRIHGFTSVDMARVYLTDPNLGVPSGTTYDYASKFGLEVPPDDEVIAILVKDGVLVAPYTHEDLLLPVRNPTSDENQLGYGQPEVEDLIRIMTGVINAIELNIRGISQNHIPPGILNLFGDFSATDVAELKASWNANTSGVSNRWRLPILLSNKGESGGAYIPVGQMPNEVMYSRWITLLVSIICALFQIAPDEINFDSFKTSAGGLGGSDTEERIANMKDGGLYSVITWFFSTLDEIIKLVEPGVEVYATGLTPEQAASKQEAGLVLTWGEYRSRLGEPAMDDPILNNAPMNANFIGLYMQQVQAQQQQAQPAQGVPTGADKDVNGDGDKETGVDTTGDGKTDAFQDTDEQGNRVMLDHQGQKWRVNPGDAQAQVDSSQPAPEPQQPAPSEDDPRIAKSVDISGWIYRDGEL